MHSPKAPGRSADGSQPVVVFCSYEAFLLDGAYPDVAG